MPFAASTVIRVFAFPHLKKIGDKWNAWRDYCLFFERWRQLKSVYRWNHCVNHRVLTDDNKRFFGSWTEGGKGKLGSLLTWNTFHSLMLTSAWTLQLTTQLVRCSMWGCSQNTQKVEQPVEFRAARVPLSKATRAFKVSRTPIILLLALNNSEINYIFVAHQAARFGWLLVKCQKMTESLKWKD